MANRDVELVVSLFATLILGAVYALVSFATIITVPKTNLGHALMAIAALLIPFLVLLLVRLAARQQAPAIWQGVWIGMIFVILLTGLCDGSVLLMSMTSK